MQPRTHAAGDIATNQANEVSGQRLMEATVGAEPDGLVLKQSGKSLSTLTFSIEDVSPPI